jgi:pimeloyl-ACP methyl ester carboxylesterase
LQGEYREFHTATGRIAYHVFDARAPLDQPASTLILLHNFMSSGRAAWGPLLPELTRHHRVLLPDLPGHGRSLGHPAGYEHGVMAQQLAALFRCEGVEQGHLAGCSSGGMLAQLLVAHDLVQPATLTLVSTTYSVNPNTTGNERRLAPEDFQAPRTWMEATARLHDPYRYAGYYEQELLPGFRRLRPDTAIDLPLTALRRFTMPLCLIHGAEDEFFPVSIARHMAATAPHAELHVIAQQSHALLFRQPWQVAKIMVEFLVRHTVPPSI